MVAADSIGPHHRNFSKKLSYGDQWRPVAKSASPAKPRPAPASQPAIRANHSPSHSSISRPP